MSIFHVVPVSAEDYRRSAWLKLPRFLFDYLEGGANAEKTLHANEADFNNLHLTQRVLRNVDNISTATEFLGQPVTMPVALAPVGMAGMYARRGEAQAARAAKKLGIPYTLSTVSICPLEEIQQAYGDGFWFQLYMLRDRDFVQELLQRAWNNGVRTLAFTVDLPVPGLRLRDFRNGMLGGGLPGKLSQLAQIITSPLWVADVAIKGKPLNFGNIASKVKDTKDLNAYKAFIDGQFDTTCTWQDIKWLRTIWKGKLIIKGVLEVDDALAAIDCGADAVIVSNHGARQLDSVGSTISKLPAIVDAAGTQCEIYMDGGVRDGIDVLKAVAVGAKGVLVGRPWVYALASRGEQGVVDLFSKWREEITHAMALMGVNKIDEINRDLLDEFKADTKPVVKRKRSSNKVKQD